MCTRTPWAFALCFVVATLTGCASSLPMSAFHDEDGLCYDRGAQPQTALVDAHLHFRPFGGPAVPFAELVSWLDRNGVRFVTVMGIGQMLPVSSSCVYYLDCPGTPVTPTFKNDFANAAAFAARERVARTRPGVQLTLSMTFPDLSRPESVLAGMQLLDEEYPGVFNWMGEINLVKQALFGHGHEPAAPGSFGDWAGFMRVLRERNMPLAIHADLGNDEHPTAYLALLEAMLASYPDNRIVWMHMGLSRELVAMDPRRHVKILQRLLDRYPHLMLDLSWRVIEDNYFSAPGIRRIYLPFLNEYSERILPGTDFVAAGDTSLAVYRDELRATSRVYRYLSDHAFRNIALGENYFRLLRLDYRAPPVCNRRR